MTEGLLPLLIGSQEDAFAEVVRPARSVFLAELVIVGEPQHGGQLAQALAPVGGTGRHPGELPVVAVPELGRPAVALDAPAALPLVQANVKPAFEVFADIFAHRFLALADGQEFRSPDMIPGHRLPAELPNLASLRRHAGDVLRTASSEVCPVLAFERLLRLKKCLPVEAVRLHVPGHGHEQVVMRRTSALRLEHANVAGNPAAMMGFPRVEAVIELRGMAARLIREREKRAVVPAPMVEEIRDLAAQHVSGPGFAAVQESGEDEFFAIGEIGMLLPDAAFAVLADLAIATVVDGFEFILSRWFGGIVIILTRKRLAALAASGGGGHRARQGGRIRPLARPS